MPKMKPELFSSPALHRFNGGRPVLTSADVPYPSNLVFNCAVQKLDGRYVMLFRNDYGYDPQTGRFGGTNLGLAWSEDGLDWRVEPEPVWQLETDEIRRIYDPRLTIIDGEMYVCFAMDTWHGLRGGIAHTPDLHRFDIVSLSAPDNRNMVLFPEKIGGYYYRLERPMPVYSRGKDRFDTWISKSPDLKFWGESQMVLPVEAVPYANDKTGPAAPPIRTKAGWLALFHAVDLDESRGKNGWEDAWRKRYCAGLMLLDLEDPSKVLGVMREPLIAPETYWEVDEGFRTNAVFPCGMVLEDDGEVRIYYGAGDAVICLATANVDELIDLCLAGGPISR